MDSSKLEGSTGECAGAEGVMDAGTGFEGTPCNQGWDPRTTEHVFPVMPVMKDICVFRVTSRGGGQYYAMRSANGWTIQKPYWISNYQPSVRVGGGVYEYYFVELHELCHAQQEWYVSQFMSPYELYTEEVVGLYSLWNSTPAGKALIELAKFNAVVNDQGDPVHPFWELAPDSLYHNFYNTSPFELGAEICALKLYFDITGEDTYVSYSLEAIKEALPWLNEYVFVLGGASRAQPDSTTSEQSTSEITSTTHTTSEQSTSETSSTQNKPTQQDQETDFNIIPHLIREDTVRLTVSWIGGDNAKYQVVWKEKNAPEDTAIKSGLIERVNGSRGAYTISGLELQTTYEFYIEAYVGDSNTPQFESEIVEATTGSSHINAPQEMELQDEKPETIPSIDIQDGDLIQASGDIDVYIVKIVGNKRFKRLILNPTIFESYGHLEWENIKIVPESTLSIYTISNMVQEIYPDGSIADERVFQLFPSGDTGVKRHISLTPDQFNAAGGDWDSIYYINQIEAGDGFYSTGTIIDSSEEFRNILRKQTLVTVI